MPSDRITLALDAKHLDYIANVLARQPWAEANPVLTDLQQQVAAFNRAQLDANTSGPVMAGNSHGEARDSH